MKNLRIVGLIMIVIVVGCGGSKSEWKGTLSGDYSLDGSDPGPSPLTPNQRQLDSGPGTVTLETGVDNILRTGKDTPLPDCLVSFYPGTPIRDTLEKAIGMEFRIKESVPPKRGGPGGPEGCVGVMEKGKPPVPVKFISAEATLHDNGEFLVRLQYREANGATDANGYYSGRTLTLKGQRGWF